MNSKEKLFKEANGISQMTLTSLNNLDICVKNKFRNIGTNCC